MTNAFKFKWVKPPSDLAKEIEKYAERVLIAVQSVASYVGVKMMNEAHAGAPWEDRSRAARGGLFFAVDGFGLPPIVGEVTPEAKAKKTDITVAAGSRDTLILTLGHTVYYGKFLELAHGGKYAIVMSTVERNLPGLEKMLQDLFRGG